MGLGNEREWSAETMGSFSQEIQATLEAFKQGLAAPMSLLAPDVQKDWNLASGFQAYNLEAPAKVLLPQLTPIRNVTARVTGRGKQVEFKAVTALNNTSLSGWVAEGSAANTVQTTSTDIIAVYKSMALADKVTFESQWAATGYQDLKSLAVTNLLRAMMIQEENNLLFGQNTTAASNQQAPGSVGNCANPTLTTSTSGGSIAASTTYGVKVTAITGMGESNASAQVTSTTGAGSNNSITVTPVFPSGQPVFGFRVYAGASGGPWYLVTSANVASVYSGATLNGLSWLTNGQAITLTSIPTSGTQAPTTDNSASSLAYNGLIAQMFGGSGATLNAVNGTLAVSNIDTLLLNMWNAGRADPDGLWCNAQESVKLTNLTLGGGAPYYVMVNEQNQATGSYRVARFTNKVTGTELPVKVHPTLPQGFMLALSSKLPGWYVPTDVPSVWALDLPQDYIEIDYPPTQSNPFWQVEVRLYGTLKLYLPLVQGALYGINNS